MARGAARNRIVAAIALVSLALLPVPAAGAGSLDPSGLRGDADRGFSRTALPGWLDPDPLRFALPVPEPLFASRLRWEIETPAPLPAAPPPATLVGWLPSILLAGAFAAVQFGVEPPEHSRWSDRNGFDSGVRRVFRGDSRDARDGTAIASDVLFGGLGAALVADWWWLREEYGFLRSIQVDTRWVLANNLTTRIAKVAAGRQRPYVQPCGRDGDWVGACGGGRNGNASFFSGHASNAATLAGLLCARHLHRRDRTTADALVCGGAAAGAVATGVLRIVSERHFATDILAGWAVGAFFGYFLPSRLDYLGSSDAARALRSIHPVVGRDYYGLEYGFRF